MEFGEDVNLVDFEVYPFELYQEFVDEIASMEGEWGNGVDAPMIAIKDVPLDLTEENIKGKLNVIWDIYGVMCIKRFTSNVWKEEFIGKKKTVDIVARFVTDNFTGEGSLEIVEVIPIK